MPFLGIVFIGLSSFLAGSLITTVFRERKSDYVVKFATGFLSLFAFLLLAVLAALKLDWDIERLSLVYMAMIAAVSCISGLVLVKKGTERPELNIDRRNLAFYIIATATGIVSFLLLSQSLINDDSLETVNTTISTGTIYSYSSLTGIKMVNGLPIYNKVYVIPMFYAILNKLFGLSPLWMMMTAVPLVIYITNLLLVSKISEEIGTLNKNVFMSVYVLLLISSTYLPSFGIPVTGGYALLRQGYSGYAVLYGIALPLIILMILKKKYIMAVIYALMSPELVRIDRVIFAVKDAAKSYISINSAGKMMALFMVSLLVSMVLALRYQKKICLKTILSPLVFTTYVISAVTEYVKGKRERIMAFGAVAIVALLCTFFEPFKAARPLYSFIKERSSVSECLELLSKDYKDIVIYSDTDFMAYVRICKGNTRVAYGRDFDSPYMLGLDYEEKSEMLADYDRNMKNHLADFDYLVTDKLKGEIIKDLAAEGVNTVIFPESYDIDRVKADYEAAGYRYAGLYGNYIAFSLY